MKRKARGNRGRKKEVVFVSEEQDEGRENSIATRRPVARH